MSTRYADKGTMTIGGVEFEINSIEIRRDEPLQLPRMETLDEYIERVDRRGYRFVRFWTSYLASPKIRPHTRQDIVDIALRVFAAADKLGVF